MVVKVVGMNGELVNLVREVVDILPRLHYKAFELDFKNLAQIRVFESFKEYSATLKEEGEEIDEKVYHGVLGKYDPVKKEVHILGYNAPDELTFIMGLLHELSHFIMDDHDLFSVKRYKTDLIYRFYEEIRVNNLSYYLAKHLLGDGHLIAAKKFRDAFDKENREVLELIKTEMPIAWDVYVSNGRGVATLYDL